MSFIDKQKKNLSALYGPNRSDLLESALKYWPEKERNQGYAYVSDFSNCVAVRELIDSLESDPAAVGAALREHIGIGAKAPAPVQADAPAPAEEPAPAAQPAPSVQEDPVVESFTFKNTTDMSSETNFDAINHPAHYNEWQFEVIDMMQRIYGKQATGMWCEMTAFKYAMRMGFKPGESPEENLQKRNWYLQKSKELLKG